VLSGPARNQVVLDLDAKLIIFPPAVQLQSKGAVLKLVRSHALIPLIYPAATMFNPPFLISLAAQIVFVNAPVFLLPAKNVVPVA
jgi:hypothetical protein